MVREKENRFIEMVLLKGNAADELKQEYVRRFVDDSDTSEYDNTPESLKPLLKYLRYQTGRKD